MRRLIMQNQLVPSISGLSQYLEIEDLLLSPSAYLADRRRTSQILTPQANGRRAFGVRTPLPTSVNGAPRLPRVLREATTFVMIDRNIKTQGIFRASARIQSIQILMAAYDRGQKFIVWREGSVALASSHRKEGTGEVYVDELETTDGFELMAACAIIKHWYKELKEPIFPTSSYQALEKFFDGTSFTTDISLDPPTLLEMLDLGDEWSPIASKASRQILRMHLLPMLSRVVKNSDYNQMTPENLAICIAPTLLRGPDPVKDMRLSRVVQRILTAMIVHWEKDLAPEIGMDGTKFEDSLLMPAAVDDREDPMEQLSEQISSEHEAQMSGITLVDNDNNDAEDGVSGPTLPARRSTQDSLDGSRASNANEYEEREGTPPPLPPRPGTITRKPLSIGASSSTSSLAATESQVGPSNTANEGPPHFEYNPTGDLTPTIGSMSRSRSSTIASFATAAESASGNLDTDSIGPSDGFVSGSTAEGSQSRRKPAPEAISLPRYSTLFGPGPSALSERPAYYNTVAPVDEDGWEQHQGLIYQNEDEMEPPPLYQDTEFSAFTEEHIAITPVTPRAIPLRSAYITSDEPEDQVVERHDNEIEPPSVHHDQPTSVRAEDANAAPPGSFPASTPTIHDDVVPAPCGSVTAAPPDRLPPPPPPPPATGNPSTNASTETPVPKEPEPETSPWSG